MGRRPPGGAGLSGPEEYFNAGVLLLNLDKMRRDGSTDRLLHYARANAGRLVWRDQDALNVVIGANHVRLHPRWNCMNSVIEFPQSIDVFGAVAVAEARGHPAIRHFEGPSLHKPWHYLSDARHAAALPSPPTGHSVAGRHPRGQDPGDALASTAAIDGAAPRYARLVRERQRRAGMSSGQP